MSNVNENIRNFRKFRGLSQEAVAKRVNRSTNVISNWENGVHSPDLDACEELCRILKVTPNELFGWEECKEYEAWKKEAQAIENELQKMVEEKKIMEDRIAEYYKRLTTMRNPND